MLLLLLLVLLVSLPPDPALAQKNRDAQAIEDEIVAVLDLVDEALADWFARSLPLPSASAGVSYSFDPAIGTFQRDPATFGQIYLERADPLGAGRFNFLFAYQYTSLDELEGMEAENLSDPSPIPLPDLTAAIEVPHLGIDAAVHSFMFALGYGLTDDWDVAIALPLLFSDLHVDAQVGAAGFTASGESFSLSERLEDESHVVGIGDILLRTKYRLLALEELHASAGMLLRLPSGDPDDLQGTGYAEVAPSLVASTRPYEAAWWARFQGHGNATIGFNTDDVDASEARWGVGMDWGIGENVTASASFLGRHPFSRIGPVGAFDLTRCDTEINICAAVPTLNPVTEPLYGLTGERADYYTAVIGGRAGIWRDTLFAFGSVAIPLNDGFVRTDPIPLVGVEATF